MYRVDTTQETERWAFGCPADGHRHWRAVDGHFQCLTCDDLYDSLRHLPSGELVPREEIELVGPHADHMAAFDPRVDG